MLYIAICDDEQPLLELLSETIEKEFKRQEKHFIIETFLSGKELKESILKGRTYDVLFLDIDMPDDNGLTLAKELQVKGINPLIVFITSHEEYVYQSFQVNPFRFIRKEKFKQEIEETISALCGKLSKTHNNYAVFETNHGIIRLEVSKIIYIESYKQFLNIVLKNDTISIKYKLMDAEELLKSFGFIRIHKGYLVNFNYINNIQKDHLVLDSADILPISRHRIGEVKKRFLQLVHDNK